MIYSKIEAASLDLFSLEPWTAAKRPTNDKARNATEREVRAYLIWIAERTDLPRFADVKVHGNGYYVRDNSGGTKGATFGKELAPARWENGTSVPPVYEPGAYSIPMPGANQRRIVTMETLDDDGAVMASQSLPVEPKKHGVIWDAKSVRAAAGKVARPPKAKRTPPIAAQEPEASPPAGDGIAERVSGLCAQVAALQAMVDVLTARADTSPLSVESAPEPAPEPVEALSEAVAPWAGAKAFLAMRDDTAARRREVERARRLRTVRLYLAMRRERAELRRQVDTAEAKRARAIGKALATRAGRAAAAEMVRTASAEIIRLKSIPHDRGTAIKPGDVARLTAERDEARGKLQGAIDAKERMAHAVDQTATHLEAMTERALRAEHALRAVEERKERGGAPYRIASPAVAFRVAA